MKTKNLMLRLLLIGVLPMLAACGAAIAAGAGAAAVIAYNERGVSTQVEGTVQEVYQKSRAAFQAKGITQTATDANDEGTETELQGRGRDNMEVTVDIGRENENFVSVDVYAQRSTVNWDHSYAQEVLESIVRRD